MKRLTQSETLSLLVTRIQLEMRSGRLPFEFGGSVMERAIELTQKEKAR